MYNIIFFTPFSASVRSVYLIRYDQLGILFIASFLSLTQVRFPVRSRCCFVNSWPEQQPISALAPLVSQSLLVAGLGSSPAAFGFLTARAGVQINGRNVTSHRGLPATSLEKEKLGDKSVLWKENAGKETAGRRVVLSFFPTRGSHSGLSLRGRCNMMI